MKEVFRWITSFSFYFKAFFFLEKLTDVLLPRAWISFFFDLVGFKWKKFRWILFYIMNGEKARRLGRKANSINLCWVSIRICNKFLLFGKSLLFFVCVGRIFTCEEYFSQPAFTLKKIRRWLKVEGKLRQKFFVDGLWRTGTRCFHSLLRKVGWQTVGDDIY